MNINRESLEKIAHLSRLELNPEAMDKMLQEFNQMLAFVEKLKEVDTTGVEPLQSMTHEINRTRPDEVKDQILPEQGLKQAPIIREDYFIVPKVIE
jgi:aspartyl-tRNA(Asn)/glutamyl-tRNA(Gln) amidotransferase subunit C